MTIPRCCAAFLMIVSAALAQASAPSKAGSSPTTEKESAELPEAVQKAVAELSKEMEAVLKDPKSATRRTKCDYFENSPESIDEKVLADLLDRRLHKQVEVDAYVKWQVLSIQKQAFTDDVAKRVTQSYRKTPKAPYRPGSRPEDQTEMTQVASLIKPDQKEVIDQRNKDWAAKLKANENIYGPMFELRNELYARLPKNIETVRAGFDDADSRIMAGYDSDKFIKTITGDLRTVSSGLKPVEINQMVALMQLLSGKSGPPAYAKLYVNSKKVVTWQKERNQPRWTKSICEQLAQDLTAMARAG